MAGAHLGDGGAGLVLGAHPEQAGTEDRLADDEFDRFRGRIGQFGMGLAHTNVTSHSVSPAAPQANSTLTKVPMMNRSATPVSGAFSSG